MKRIVFLFFCFGTNWLFAVDNSDIIWTWGNGKAIAGVLSFLYFFLNIDTLSVMIKFAALIGSLIVLFKELAKGASAMPSVIMLKVFFFFVISQTIVTGFLTVKQDDAHRVYILSANELSSASWSKCRAVNGSNDCFAPIGIKLLYGALTNFERAGLFAMESSMMDANALTYSFSRMGLGFGFTFYDEISKTKGDPYTYNTFMDFYENCIIYDLSDGSKTVDGIYRSNDLATYILSQNSRLTNVYTASNPNGTLHTCYEVSANNLWGNISCNSTAQKLKAKASGSQAAEGTTDDICEAAQNFGQMMFNSTKGASEQIQQRTIMNLTNESIINSAVASGMDPSVLAYGTAMADREQTSKWMTMGMMAKEWIPTLRGMMQGIALGLVWIFALLAIASASTLPLASFLGFQLTLVVWSFILAFINYMTILKMGDTLPNIFFGELPAGDQMTLWSQPTFDEENQKALAFLGYMGFASYGIAAAIVHIGGNRMASAFGGALSQISVGMGNSANMAKGHFDGGMDKSDSSGSQHKNSRTGDLDRTTPSGYRETQANQEGHSNYKESASSKYGGSNDIEKTTNSDGTSAFKASYGNESVSMNGTDGKVTNANLGSAIQASADQAYSHEIESTKGQAAAYEKSGNETLSSAINDTNTTAQSTIKSVNSKEGTGAGTDVAKTYNEQTQHNLTEAFKEINGSDEKLQKLRGIDMSAGVGVKFLGNGATVTGTSSANSADTVSVNLSKEEASALSQSMATGLAVTAKTNENITADLAKGVIQKSDSALTQTNQASHAYSEAYKLTETASKMEKDKEGVSASLKKDLNIEVAQKIIDDMGFQNGTDALLHDKGLVERTAAKVVQNKIDNMPTVDTNSTFNKAENGISHSKGNVNPVNTSDPRTMNMDKSYDSYKGDVNNKGNSYLNTMPDTNNAPNLQHDHHVENEVEASKSKHDARGKDLIPNAIPDSVRDTANVKFSPDGTYTDYDGAKHDWSNKGRKEH